MKKTIILSAMVLYIFSAVASVFMSATETGQQTESVPTTAAETATNARRTGFTVKSVAGKIAVEDSDGRIVKTTSTRVAILPEKDREQLENGIKAETPRELKRILEDLCS